MDAPVFPWDPPAFAVPVPAPQPDTLAARTWWLRIAGVLVGGAVPALFAAVAWWLHVDYVAVVAACGVPVGALLVGATAHRIVGRDGAATTVVLIVTAPFIAALVIAAAMTFGSSTPGLEIFGAVISIGVIVIVVAEIGGVPVTAPVGVVTALLLRRLASLTPGRGLAWALVLALAAALLGGITFAAAGPLAAAFDDVGLRPVAWAGDHATTHVRWAVVNHTRDELSIEIGWAVDGQTEIGEATGVDPCSVAVGSTDAQGPWVIRALSLSEDGFGESENGAVVARAADAPGKDVAVTVTVWPGGRTTTRSGESRPAAGPLDARSCA